MKKGWHIKKLGDVCEIIKGRKPVLKAAPSDGDLRYLVAKVMRGNDEAQYASVRDRNSVTVSDSETIIICDGSNSGEIFTGFRGILSSTMGKISKKGEIDDDYLRVFLDSTFEVFNGAKTGAAIPHLDIGALYRLDFPLPPLPEQRRIVGILGRAFEGIAAAEANAEKNLQNARALFASHLQSVFARRGDGWVEKRLGEICERVSVGHVGPTAEFYCKEAEGIPFLRSQNVRRGHLDWDGIQYVTKEFHSKLRKSQLRAGDLLFVRVGANRGDCCSVPNDVGEINCANIVFSRPIERNAAYLARYCDSTYGREQLLGMTTGSAQGVINTSSVAELIVPLPPLPEQKRIVDFLNQLQTETQRLESIYQRKLAALEGLKKSLLHQAFTGHL
jgi:type I restriction enzyme S subunit